MADHKSKVMVWLCSGRGDAGNVGVGTAGCGGSHAAAVRAGARRRRMPACFGMVCSATSRVRRAGYARTSRQHLEECLEYPGVAEPPEPLPYAVPFARFAREWAPRYAVTVTSRNLRSSGHHALTLHGSIALHQTMPARSTQAHSVIVSLSGSLMPVTQ